MMPIKPTSEVTFVTFNIGGVTAVSAREEAMRRERNERLMRDHREDELRYMTQMFHINPFVPAGHYAVDFGQAPTEPQKEMPPAIKLDAHVRMDYLENLIDRVIQNGDATIVIWRDNSKTVVKRAADEEYNLYAAVAQAVMKKFMGSTSRAHKVIKQKTVVQKPKEPKVKQELLPAPTPAMEEVLQEIRTYEGEANEAND